MKIKHIPEDFVVKEIADIPFSKNGEFGIYRLTKNGVGTTEILLEICNRNRVSTEDCAHGGKIDKYSIATQHISIAGKKRFDTFELRGNKIEFIGYAQRDMGPDLVSSNAFELCVRDISPEDAQYAKSQIQDIADFGFFNYFDDQRFGSYDKLQGFLAEKVLKEHFNGAVKIYLTSIDPQDNQKDKDRKFLFSQHWKDWQFCFENSGSDDERSAFNYLMRNPSDFVGFLCQIPKEEMTLYINAFQSFVWNETLRRYFLSTGVQDKLVHPGKCGDYFFYSKLDSQDKQYWQSVHFATLSSKMGMPSAELNEIHEKLMDELGIRRPMFNKMKIRQAFFKSFERRAVVTPKNMQGDIADDDKFPEKKKLNLTFELPRGSYATLLLKRIFSKKQEL